MDNTAAIWAIDNSEPQLVLKHTTGVRAAAFRPPGERFVVTGAEDGGVRLWRTSLPDLVEYLAGATKSAGCLSTRERVQFLGESEDKAGKNYRICEAGLGRVKSTSSQPK